MNNSAKILLVDDEKRFAATLQKKILSHCKYTCSVAHSGYEAIRLFEKEQFDLALLDVGLPDMSGCELAKHIRTSYPHTTFIMLTGLNSVQTAVQSLKIGAYDFLNKPISHNVLVKTLEKALKHNKLKQEKLELENKLAQASKLNALGLMAGSVAHDLNNILSGIVSYPDLLLMQMDESDKFYEQILRIQSAGKRAAAVVSDLVTIARGGKVNKSVENLNDIVVNYLNSLEHNDRQINYPNIAIRTKLHKNIHNCYCSPQHIHKILLNLIGNGLEAVGSRGNIGVSTENCVFFYPNLVMAGEKNGNSYVKLTITDDGPGIDEGDIDHIFEPFYSQKVMGKSGTGLGLSIVWNIVQEHGGWIDVKNTSPGVAFEIYFPATRHQVSPMDKQIDINDLKGQGERILLIDDLVEQNSMVEKALREIGYNVNSVTSGEAGIAFLQNSDVDLVLLDMIMGEGMNGRETLEIIRKDRPM